MVSKLNPAQIATLAVMMLSLAILMVATLFAQTDNLELLGTANLWVQSALWFGLGVYVASFRVKRWWMRGLFGFGLYVLSVVSAVLIVLIPSVGDALTDLVFRPEFYDRVANGDHINLPVLLLPLFAVYSVIHALPFFVTASWPNGGVRRGDLKASPA